MLKCRLIFERCTIMKNAEKLIQKRENRIPLNSDKPIWAHTNHARFYNAVVPLKGGEFRLDTYAVKTRNKRTGELAIKKVARYYSNRNRYYVRDILYHNTMHTYCVNWCNEPFGRKHQAVWEDVDASIGIWGYNDRDKDGTIDLGGEWLNWFDGTKYAHCGWSAYSGMHILDYIDCWRINKGVEFLGKSDLWRLITPSFVRKLAADKGLFCFFREHLNEIRKPDCRGGYYAAYSINEILHAYRHKTTLADAHATHEARYLFRGAYNQRYIPSEVNRFELAKYLNKNDIKRYEYLRYAEYVHNCGEDICAFGVTMPRDFRTALEEYESRANEIEAKKLIRKHKAYNSGIKSVSDMFAMLSRLSRNGLTVVLPVNVKQLVSEGNAMHNCIGTNGYDKRICEGKSLVVFLYKDGKPFVDIEIDRERWTVRQCYAKCNTQTDEKIEKFAKLICNKAKAIYRKAA